MKTLQVHSLSMFHFSNEDIAAECHSLLWCQHILCNVVQLWLVQVCLYFHSGRYLLGVFLTISFLLCLATLIEIGRAAQEMKLLSASTAYWRICILQVLVWFWLPSSNKMKQFLMLLIFIILLKLFVKKDGGYGRVLQSAITVGAKTCIWWCAVENRWLSFFRVYPVLLISTFYYIPLRVLFSDFVS